MGRYTPRERGRAVTDADWIRSFLAASPTGVLGTVSDDEPFLTPLLFVYDPEKHAIFVHLSTAGQTAANVAENPQTTFVVFTTGRLLPDRDPAMFDLEYESVIAHGSAVVVEDRVEKRRALEAMMEKYAPQLGAGVDYEPMTQASIEMVGIIRLDVDHWSGKRNAASDTEEGYSFEAV